MERVESVILSTIQKYEQDSQSRSFWRLRKENSGRIAKNIIQKKQAHNLIELIKKRDYYTKKIYGLLNDAGEETDPRLITSQVEAEHYVRKHIISDQAKSDQIKSLIEKHKQLQSDFAGKQEKLLAKLHQKSTKFSDLKKLESLNANSQIKKQSEIEAEIGVLYATLAQKQNEYSRESVAMLRSLHVPFFDSELAEGPELESYRISLLNSLYKSLG